MARRCTMVRDARVGKIMAHDKPPVAIPRKRSSKPSIAEQQNRSARARKVPITLAHVSFIDGKAAR